MCAHDDINSRHGSKIKHAWCFQIEPIDDVAYSTCHIFLDELLVQDLFDCAILTVSRPNV